MAKASVPSLTKTRMVPPLTFEEAARFNTAFLRDIAEKLLHAGELAAISGAMAYGPAGAAQFFEQTMPAGVGAFECWLPGFGACLLHATETLLSAGHGAACVLNSDSPTLPVEHLLEAARALAGPGDAIVLGPSTDGGYYLLGMRRPHAHLFEAIDWSTERVAEQTLQRAREVGLPVHILPEWYDVDDAETLRRLQDDLDGIGPFRGSDAPHTRILLRELSAVGDFALRLAAGNAVLPAGAAL